MYLGEELVGQEFDVFNVVRNCQTLFFNAILHSYKVCTHPISTLTLLILSILGNKWHRLMVVVLICIFIMSSYVGQIFIWYFYVVIFISSFERKVFNIRYKEIMLHFKKKSWPFTSYNSLKFMKQIFEMVHRHKSGSFYSRSTSRTGISKQ